MQNMETLGNLMIEQEERGTRRSSGHILDEENPKEISIMNERITLFSEFSNLNIRKDKPITGLNIGPTASHGSFFNNADYLLHKTQGVRTH